MEVAELAAADFVHPDPFPRGAEIHHLLGHVSQIAQLFACFFESLRRARRQVAHRLIGLGTLARAQVKITGPIIG